MNVLPPCALLVLDDEPLILLDLEYAIGDAGCVALTAMDVEEALGIINCHPVDAAILDVTLGRGCTCAPVVEALVERGIPYVLHTGDPNRLDEFIRSLGGELVSKPTPAAQVVERALAQADGRIHLRPANP